MSVASKTMEEFDRIAKSHGKQLDSMTIGEFMEIFQMGNTAAPAGRVLKISDEDAIRNRAGVESFFE